MTMLTTACGLVAFASALERFFVRRATWLETAMFVIAAGCLFWPAIDLPPGGVWFLPGVSAIPTWLLDVVGLAFFAGVLALQFAVRPKDLRPLPKETGAEGVV
jgi:TRAP-type uncharacterized transport system fused permease subunit